MNRQNRQRRGEQVSANFQATADFDDDINYIGVEASQRLLDEALSFGNLENMTVRLDPPND